MFHSVAIGDNVLTRDLFYASNSHAVVSYSISLAVGSYLDTSKAPFVNVGGRLIILASLASIVLWLQVSILPMSKGLANVPDLVDLL